MEAIGTLGTFLFVLLFAFFHRILMQLTADREGRLEMHFFSLEQELHYPFLSLASLEFLGLKIMTLTTGLSLMVFLCLFCTVTEQHEVLTYHSLNVLHNKQ